MPTIPQILRSRQRRREATRDTSLKRIGFGSALVISVIFAIILIGGTIYYALLTRDLPSIEILPVLLEPPDGLLLQPTRFYDRDKANILLELENPAIEERTYLP